MRIENSSLNENSKKINVGYILHLDKNKVCTGEYRLVIKNDDGKYQLLSLDGDSYKLVPAKYDNLDDMYDYYKTLTIAIYNDDEYKLKLLK